MENITEECSMKKKYKDFINKLLKRILLKIIVIEVITPCLQFMIDNQELILLFSIIFINHFFL